MFQQILMTIDIYFCKCVTGTTLKQPNINLEVSMWTGLWTYQFSFMVSLFIPYAYKTGVMNLL